MPCVYETPEEYLLKENEHVKEKLDDLTSMLCSACQVLEEKQCGIPKNVRKWWKNHKEFDKKRLKSRRRARKKEIKLLSKRKKKLDSKIKALEKRND